jgi:hypothetical protein
MSEQERIARGGRVRPRRPAPAQLLSTWETRAEKLEVLGMQLVEEATSAKLTTTPSNGVQMSPKFAAGLKLLDAASELWQRLYRIAPPERPPSSNGAPGSAPPPSESLDAFSRRRPRG